MARDMRTYPELAWDAADRGATQEQIDEAVKVGKLRSFVHEMEGGRKPEQAFNNSVGR